MTTPKTTQSKRAIWPWLLLGAFALTATYHGCTGTTKPPATPPKGTGLTESSKAGLAAIMNVNGELCAAVTGVASKGNDVYEVTCQRWRDGTGQAIYLVDMRTGKVK
jgi:hypothetical protein